MEHWSDAVFSDHFVRFFMAAPDSQQPDCQPLVSALEAFLHRLEPSAADERVQAYIVLGKLSCGRAVHPAAAGRPPPLVEHRPASDAYCWPTRIRVLG